MFDTIVAPITASGGAVSLIRLSGPEAWALAAKVCTPFPTNPESHRMYRVKFSNQDDGLVGLFEHGRSYTGEETAEIHVHGSSLSVATLCENLIAKGARMARPGEFSERAFLNGNLDLTQAEYINDTVRASTRRQLAIANEGRSGALHKSIESIESVLTKHLAAIEASVDFSEEIGEADTNKIRLDLQPILNQLDDLIIRSEQGRIIREGLRIAIVGPPNAGKSSLLNRLLGAQRAIVTDIAGTTRDYVEETCELGGLLCLLIDTAGIRESEDVVESLGIQRARSQAAQADLIWYLVDANIGLTPNDEQEIASFAPPVWKIVNKIDNHKTIPPATIGISTYTGEGIAQLIQQVSELVPELGGVVPNRRHSKSLTSVRESVEAILMGIQYHHPDDLLVTHFRSALFELGQITGTSASTDLLERIFSDFCIGK